MQSLVDTCVSKASASVASSLCLHDSLEKCLPCTVHFSNTSFFDTCFVYGENFEVSFSLVPIACGFFFFLKVWRGFFFLKIVPQSITINYKPKIPSPIFLFHRTCQDGLKEGHGKWERSVI